MSLPIQDLRLQIQEELDKNPALEVVEDLSTVSLEEVETPRKADLVLRDIISAFLPL